MYKYQYTSKGKDSHKDKKQKQNRPKQDTSSFVTQRRLTRHPGIFERGRTTGAVLRDPSIREETIARAEENLSLILELASKDNFKGEITNKETHIVEEFSKRSNKVAKHSHKYFKGRSKRVAEEKRCRTRIKSAHKDVSNSSTPLFTDSQLPEIVHSNTSENSGTQFLSRGKENNLTENCSSLRAITREKNSTTHEDDDDDDDDYDDSNTKHLCAKESESFDIPYSKFAKTMKLSLLEASKNLAKDYDYESELCELLRNTYEHRSSQFTPPSGIKGMSHYLDEFDSSINASTKEVSPLKEKNRPLECASSSSVVTPNFDVTVCPPTLVINPRGMIERYEQKLKVKPDKKKENTELKCKESESSKHTVSLPCKSPFKTARTSIVNVNKTPLKSPENCLAIPKSVVVNPLNYIERYEKNMSTSTGSSSKVCLQNGRIYDGWKDTLSFSQNKQDSESENRADFPLWSADCQNYRQISSPLLNSNYPPPPTNSYSYYSHNPQFPTNDNSHCSHPPSFSLLAPQPSIDYRANAFTKPCHQYSVATLQQGNGVWESGANESTSDGHYYQRKISHLPFSRIINPSSPYTYSPAVGALPTFSSNHRNNDHQTTGTNDAQILNTRHFSFDRTALSRNDTNENFTDSLASHDTSNLRGGNFCVDMHSEPSHASHQTMRNKPFRFSPNNLKPTPSSIEGIDFGCANYFDNHRFQ